MTGRKKQIGIDQRDVIARGLNEGWSARRIAASIGVHPSTVTREVKANRTVRERPRGRSLAPASRCARYRDCDRAGTACPGCRSAATRCKRCRTRSCTDSCPDYERKMCPETGRWPYVCPPGCPRRRSCAYPKCSYDAPSAQAAHRERLSSSRSGIAITPEELRRMNEIVAPLARRGQSFEAIWAEHGDELPVGVRTAYSYQASGALQVASIDLPRKVRLRPRKGRKAPGRDRVDRSGRTHDDFLALPLTERARAVQCDSVCGFERNRRDLLSLHLVATGLHVYLLKEHASPAATVGALDAVERASGSRGAFEAAFGVVLADRGVEFDDWEGMERSCLEPGERRCRVFYCDPMESNQKAQCERDHSELRRILPKGRTDFDALTPWDVAVASSHVNSYPRPGRGGRCPLELASGTVPPGLLEGLGIERVPADEVTLRPTLVPHAVER